MRILLLVLVPLFAVSNAYAQHPFWLDEAIRVDNPDEMAYWIAVEADCPMTEAEIESVIGDVLAEKRIRPARNKIFEEGRIYLNLDLRCASVVPEDNYAFIFNVHFGRYKPWPAILFDVPYSDFGIGSGRVIRQTCKERVEAAVAVFIRANKITVGQRSVHVHDARMSERPLTTYRTLKVTF